MRFSTPDGKAPRFTWPGGYAILYHDLQGDTLCADCASKPHTDYVLTSFIHWEGPPEYCADCNKECASEYGDPSECCNGTCEPKENV